MRSKKKKRIKTGQPIYQRATRLTTKLRDDITGFTSREKEREETIQQGGEDRKGGKGERKSPLPLKGVNVSRLNLKC